MEIYYCDNWDKNALLWCKFITVMKFIIEMKVYQFDGILSLWRTLFTAMKVSSNPAMKLNGFDEKYPLGGNLSLWLKNITKVKIYHYIDNVLQRKVYHWWLMKIYQLDIHLSLWWKFFYLSIDENLLLVLLRNFIHLMIEKKITMMKIYHIDPFYFLYQYYFS